MKILIKERGYSYNWDFTTKSDYVAAVKEIAGQWVDVDTNSLFENQYNVTTPSGKGLRIMQDQVIAVQDDERQGKARCNYCGKISEWKGIPLCSHCNQYGYLKEFNCNTKQHIVKVNKNWILQYTTNYGSILPYGYAEITIQNTKTGDVTAAQKWSKWDSCHIEKDIPQVVKNEIRKILKRYNLHFRNWWITSYTEHN